MSRTFKWHTEIVTSLVVILRLTAGGQALTQPEQTMLAFPADAAGLSAYVKLEQRIKITEELSRIFERIEDVGGNYIIGTVKVTNFVGDVYPHLYVDTEGWVVAYFLSNEPASLVMHWSGNAYDPNPFIGSTLEEALARACQALKVQLPAVSYYDFRYPKANNILILLSVLPTSGTKNMYVKIPSTYKLYSVSYFMYGCNLERPYTWESYSLVLKLNGSPIDKLEGNERTGISTVVKEFPLRDFALDKMHEITVEYTQGGQDGGSAGIAWVLIFQVP